MPKKCKHNRVSFIGMLHYREYPEKLFKCLDCETPITDFVTTKEYNEFKDKKIEELNLSW